MMAGRIGDAAAAANRNPNKLTKLNAWAHKQSSQKIKRLVIFAVALECSHSDDARHKRVQHLILVLFSLLLVRATLSGEHLACHAITAHLSC